MKPKVMPPHGRTAGLWEIRSPFQMPHSVEMAFVKAMECPMCHSNLLLNAPPPKDASKVYCPVCGWTPSQRTAGVDDLPDFDDDEAWDKMYPPPKAEEYKLDTYPEYGYEENGEWVNKPRPGASTSYIHADGGAFTLSFKNGDYSTLHLVLGDMAYHDIPYDYLRKNGPEATAKAFDETGAYNDLVEIFKAALRLLEPGHPQVERAQQEQQADPNKLFEITPDYKNAAFADIQPLLKHWWWSKEPMDGAYEVAKPILQQADKYMMDHYQNMTNSDWVKYQHEVKSQILQAWQNLPQDIHHPYASKPWDQLDPHWQRLHNEEDWNANQEYAEDRNDFYRNMEVGDMGDRTDMFWEWYDYWQRKVLEASAGKASPDSTVLNELIQKIRADVEQQDWNSAYQAAMGAERYIADELRDWDYHFTIKRNEEHERQYYHDEPSSKYYEDKRYRALNQLQRTFRSLYLNFQHHIDFINALATWGFRRQDFEDKLQLDEAMEHIEPEKAQRLRELWDRTEEGMKEIYSEIAMAEGAVLDLQDLEGSEQAPDTFPEEWLSKLAMTWDMGGQQYTVLVNPGITDDQAVAIIQAGGGQQLPSGMWLFGDDQQRVVLAPPGYRFANLYPRTTSDFSSPLENPHNYQWVPWTDQELSAWDHLSRDEKEGWRSRVRPVNRGARRRGYPGTVTGRDIFLLHNRYRGNCAYCGQPMTRSDYSYDHVIPLGKGGENMTDNLLPCHKQCNFDLNALDVKNRDYQGPSGPEQMSPNWFLDDAEGTSEMAPQAPQPPSKPFAIEGRTQGSIRSISGQTPSQIERFIQEHKLPEDKSQVVHEFPNGYTVRKLMTNGDKAREGFIMGHCWAPYDDPEDYEPDEYDEKPLDEGDYLSHMSLRDEHNHPKASFFYVSPEDVARYRRDRRRKGVKMMPADHPLAWWNEGHVYDPDHPNYERYIYEGEGREPKAKLTGQEHIIHDIYGHGDQEAHSKYRDYLNEWAKSLPGPVYETQYQDGYTDLLGTMPPAHATGFQFNLDDLDDWTRRYVEMARGNGWSDQEIAQELAKESKWHFSIPITPDKEVEAPDWEPNEEPLTIPEETPTEAPAEEPLVPVGELKPIPCPQNIPIKPDKEVEAPDWEPTEPLTVPEETPATPAPAPAPKREPVPAKVAQEGMDYAYDPEPYGYKILRVGLDPDSQPVLVSPSQGTYWPVGQPLVAEGMPEEFKRGSKGIHLVPEGDWRELYEYVRPDTVLVKCRIYGTFWEGATGHGRGIIAQKAMPVMAVGTRRDVLLKLANKYGIDTELAQQPGKHTPEQGPQGWPTTEYPEDYEVPEEHHHEGIDEDIQGWTLQEDPGMVWKGFQFNKNKRDQYGRETGTTFVVRDETGQPRGTVTIDFYNQQAEYKDVSPSAGSRYDADFERFLSEYNEKLEENDWMPVWDQSAENAIDFDNMQYEVADWRDYTQVSDADDLVKAHENLGNYSYDDYYYEAEGDDYKYEISDDTDGYGIHYWDVTVYEPAPPELRFDVDDWNIIFNDEYEVISGGQNPDDEITKALVEVPKFILEENAQEGTNAQKQWKEAGGLNYIQEAAQKKLDDLKYYHEDLPPGNQWLPQVQNKEELEQWLEQLARLAGSTGVHPDQQRLVTPVDTAPDQTTWVPWNTPKIPGTLSNWKLAEDFSQFFDDASRGGYAPQKPYVPSYSDPEHQRFDDVWRGYSGNFDQHIDASIPGYREQQTRKGIAITKTFGQGARMLDLGSSEGSFGKAISQVGGLETDNLDPNDAMEQHFNSNPVPQGAQFVKGYFGEHDPDYRYDVVHESMLFQFIDNQREQHIQEAKRLLKPNGIFLCDEKVITPDWEQNEAEKDAWKAQWFSPEQIAEKQQVVKVQKWAMPTDQGFLDGLRYEWNDDLAVNPGEYSGLLSAYDGGYLAGLIQIDNGAIWQLDVKPRYRRKGLATKLYQLATERFGDLQHRDLTGPGKKWLEGVEPGQHEFEREDGYWQVAHTAGMIDNMVHQETLEQILHKYFRFVKQVWSSGNFVGYAASDDPNTFETYLSNLT